MNAKKKKVKINWTRVILAILILAVIIAAAVFGITRIFKSTSGQTQKESTSVPLEAQSTTGHAKTQQTSFSDEYISIDMMDCELYVGTSIELTCSCEPEELSQMVIWSVSDGSVLDITEDGRLTVVGMGTSAVTATCGTYTDSVIVKGISKETPTGDDGKPSETVTEYPIPETKGGKIVIPGINETTAQMPSTEPKKEPDTTESTGKTETQIQTQTQEPTGTTEKPKPTATPATEADKKTLFETVSASMTQLGFTHYKDNVYMFTEDGNYLGQAIVYDNKVDIYIGLRTRGLDNAIKSLMKLIIPKSADALYAQFVSTKGNASYFSGGHKMTVLNPAEGNSELMIYF